MIEAEKHKAEILSISAFHFLLSSYFSFNLHHHSRSRQLVSLMGSTDIKEIYPSNFTQRIHTLPELVANHQTQHPHAFAEGSPECSPLFPHCPLGKGRPYFFANKHDTID